MTKQDKGLPEASLLDDRTHLHCSIADLLPASLNFRFRAFCISLDWKEIFPTCPSPDFFVIVMTRVLRVCLCAGGQSCGREGGRLPAHFDDGQRGEQDCSVHHTCGRPCSGQAHVPHPARCSEPDLLLWINHCICFPLASCSCV